MLRGNPVNDADVDRSVERALHFRKEISACAKSSDSWFLDIWQPEAIDEAECWPVSPGEEWQGFGGVLTPTISSVSDPVKVAAILTPGMDGSKANERRRDAPPRWWRRCSMSTA
ncbi:hypothetical protein ACNKHQ_01105 [Shigella flexneri]